MHRNTKIIATLGPSSQDEKVITKLIQAGMDVARLNFSHGSHESHGRLIRILRKVSQKLHRPITILQDLQGPKLRIGDLPLNGCLLSAGETVILEPIPESDTNLRKSESNIIPLDIPDIFASIKKGSRILMDDGKLELEVISTTQKEIHAKVILGGILYSNKGVNLPGTIINVPGFTDKDRIDLIFGMKQGVDAIAISFVRGTQDVQNVRNTIKQIAPEKTDTPVIAKLELPEAISNLDEILESADGVMVARGDLGVETSPSVVPIVQKEIIQAANQKNKLVITATQMLDSMIENPRPTRAEASDVANAILDGSDAVMLSGETASGKYPVESIAMMHKIILDAEAHFEKWGHVSNIAKQSHGDDAFAISLAAREIAHEQKISSIAVFTQSGRSAILQSKTRPGVPILAFTPYERTYRRLGLYWGVIPYLVSFATSLEDMIKHVEKALIDFTNISPGEKVVVVSGFPIGAMGATNLALIHTIKDLDK
ncbi:MAG TPA: pyruvate kinase [Anaerolineae bacterium]|nr:pyruvate kinase [Anaerolineae bacterium]